MHQIDEMRLRLALAPSMTEDDLHLKMAFLERVEPCIISNLNLPAIAGAAIAADEARLRGASAGDNTARH